jgi:tight adherence protein B
MILKMPYWDEISLPIIAVFTFLSALFGMYKLAIYKIIKNSTVNTSVKVLNKNDIRSLGLFLSKFKNKEKILVLFSFLISFLVFYLIFKNIVFSIFIGICSLILISDFWEGFKIKRKELLHIQTVEFVNNTIVMLKAGKTVRNIFKESINWVKKPLKNYLKILINELDLNLSFDEALDRFAERCDSREVTLLSAALKINNKIGGDLVFILNSVADTLQNSLSVRSTAKTLTLQSRYSGNIISFSPVIILIVMFIFMRNSVNSFFSSNVGNIILIIGGTLEIVGIILIKKILTISK